MHLPQHPLLILKDDGHATHGLVLLTEGTLHEHAIALQLGAEPQDVAAQLERLAVSSRIGDSVLGGVFLCDVRGASVDELMLATPNSPAGQKLLLVYREDGWLMGLWNDPRNHPDRAGLSLSSVADFFGSPISKAALARRSGLESVRASATLCGSHDVLAHAAQYRSQVEPFGHWERHPGVRALADWWNSTAPEHQRLAAFARLYVWNEQDRVFDALDPEEPATTAEQMAKCPSIALFEAAGQPTVVAAFMRGREFNKSDDWGTTVFHADGVDFWETSAQPHEVDDAYYCAAALEPLSQLLQCA